MNSADHNRRWSARVHKWLGVVLLAPLCVWALTGGIFLIKPGYEQAYQKLEIQTYPAASASSPSLPQSLPAHWQQLRRLNTIVGEHRLVQLNDQWQQIELNSNHSREASEQSVRALMEDAFRINPSRYGNIVTLDGFEAVTDTQVVVRLDWNLMILTQRGDDTRLIKSLYRMHYLQWTGYSWLDKVLGITGLILLILLTALGVRLLLMKRTST
ncbi:MAG: PepSY domain-containing protein [Cellvibrionaceae bacterium]